MKVLLPDGGCCYCLMLTDSYHAYTALARRPDKAFAPHQAALLTA
ncbi:hypothetical protein AD05_3345 [Escherichia coli 5-366-08_S4_C2]|nr:hypothetical protein ECBCE007MS11_0020 [Escherichia coli BCE007_MS-11]ENB28517.1 hypothetical protein ECBCE032MS12_4998 [Escherichia coli BCE032_MS-12]ENC49442.1 hypothetical protein ECP02999173_4583 [Escherichia coli P0299917.3]END50663.1 hypothetical protein ECBCE006MS23_5104 [Escherichia coli BCE006_MS-23]ESD92892.1 hypothetical protein HMPREF1613_01438 [Escherichia coli 908616]KEL32412.1 hypothetical protein AD05_3345 [Escherichia coli 5-366-08_S4_C2]MDY9196744.1 hypothetical protein [